MRYLASFLVVVLVSSLGVSACGGNVVHGTGASGTGGAGGTGTTTTTGTTTSTTTVISRGDCTSDAQCGNGQCVELTPGGYKVCTHFPPEATMCTGGTGPMVDQCCTSADCKNGGKCYSTTNLPFCGGPAVQVYNMCVTDQCTDDASCTGSGANRICVPAGSVGSPARSCFTAYCHTDAECTAQPGGACVVVRASCCNLPAGLGCVYPGGCTKDEDCGQGNSCHLDAATGTGKCAAGPAICPV
jgi:hypothetical protein